MTVDIPADKKFVSCFIAYRGFQEKKHLTEKDWLMKGFAGNFITPCFVLLTVAFDLPLYCFCIICHFLGAGLTTFTFYSPCFCLQRSKHGDDDDTRYEGPPLLYTTTPPNFTTLDDKIPKERLFEWATTRL